MKRERNFLKISTVVFLVAVALAFFPAHLTAETTYTLETPVPGIVNLGTMSEGVNTGGRKAIWQDFSGQVHIFGAFGWSPYYGHYLNTANGDHSIVQGLNGVTWGFTYSPTHNKLYIGSNYNPGDFAEFDPVTQTLKRINPSYMGPTTDMKMGDDNRIYHLDCADGPQSHVYSYDPSVGLPNGWKNYGSIPQSAGAQYGSVGADTQWLYVAVRKADGTYTLLMTRTSGTPSWTEWEFGNVGDNAMGIGKEASTLKWFVTRGLADGTYQSYYLENGTYINTSKGRNITQPAPKDGPQHCAFEGDLPSSRYNFETDLVDLYPIKDIHEFSTIRYKPTGSTTWLESTISYTGPWVPQSIACAIPQTGNSFFGLTDAYNAAVKINYSPKNTTYLGSEVLSPYTAKENPITGEYYLGGYANVVLRYDPTQPWTLTNANATKRLPSDATKSNPYSIQMPQPGYHYRHSIDFGANGLVWIGGNTTRGTVTSPDHGDVMWYNPADGSAGYMFPDWQSVTSPVLFRNLVAAANRTKIVISANNNLLYVVDADTKTVDGTYNLGEYAFMADVDGVVVGVTPGGNIFRFDPLTRTMLTPPQSIGVAGYPFGVGNNQYSRMFFKLEKGPDGFLWMFVGNTLYRINPDTLVFSKVTDTPYAAISFASNNTDLLLYGMYGTGKDVRYIPGILVASQINATADLNSDSKVDSTDFGILKTDFLKLTGSLLNFKSDINGDGQCTVRDVGILMSGWKP